MNGSDQPENETLWSRAPVDILQITIAIADDLVDALPDSDATNLSLASGLAGQAVFFANMAKFNNFDERYCHPSQ